MNFLCFFSLFLVRPASAFQLWFEENKSTIAAEHPEVESETEIFKLAIQKWREVDTETKQASEQFQKWFR